MTLHMQVPNMACSACGDTITQAVKKLDPNSKVEANPQTKQVIIETQASDTEVQQAIKDAGYRVEDFAKSGKQHSAQERAQEDLNQDL